jgi:hypothetical protein
MTITDKIRAFGAYAMQAFVQPIGCARRSPLDVHRIDDGDFHGIACPQVS